MQRPWPHPREVRLVFGLRPMDAPSPSADASSDVDPFSLAYIGFPALSVATTFLSMETAEQWEQSHTLRFPSRCCVCMEPATTYLPTATAHGLVFPKLRPGPLAACVPHCDAHAMQGHALLLVSVERWNDAVTRVGMVGLERTFIEEAHELNRRGDAFPPWRAFPTYSPETSGWRQGTGEYWWNAAWTPFWSRLSAADKQRYIERWNAPLDWVDRLTLTLDR